MNRIHSIHVDRRAGSAYVYFEPPSPGASKRQVNIGDAILFDFGDDGRLLGIEILDPRLADDFTAPEAAEALEKASIPIRVNA